MPSNGKRRLVAGALVKSGGLGLLQRLLRGPALGRFTVINYHRILPDDEAFEPTFDRWVYDLPLGEFARQMAWLKEHTRPIALDELPALLHGPHRPERPLTMVTFDDGYRDNYELAFPVLRRLGIPSVLFVPSGLIQRRELGWWDQIAYVLRHARGDRVTLLDGDFALPGEREEAIRYYQEAVKRLSAEQTLDLPLRLAAACDGEPPPAELMDAELMTWDQIREVDRGGMTIGAHTCNHPVLGRLSEQRQFEEMAQCRVVLEQKLGRPVRALAYPVGGEEHIGPTTRKLALRAGYRLAFSYLTGVNRWGRIEPLAIRRIAPGPDRDALAAKVVLPGLF